ncbi:MAG: diadenylate cyclase CdaA [Clostridiales bacterium]|jgi:diadenylate cyclase|nr:diadenylate cyclase CdaA [Clostridiales bacterium]
MDSLRDFLTGTADLRIPEIRWQDVVDVLSIAFLIYKVTMWIRQTRAWSLSKGLFLITGAFLLSNYFGLYTINWIITNGVGAGITALIILFQPEIRRALENLGNNSLFPVFSSGGDDSSYSVLVTEIVLAVFEMARNRTGALIVIERNIGMGEYQKTGLLIDAIVTKQLLMNIFEDKTPLHDGGVLIRGSRILAATCILPLTQSEIGHELGTRHRAAVGASEVSDADIIVVSEETGSVSLAKSGKLYRKLSKETLTEMLNKSRAKSENKRVKVGGMFRISIGGPKEK